MEVFGIGPFELLLVIIISFVVLGPERIPSVMRSIGSGIRQLQQAMQQVLTTESGEKISIPREVAELQRDLKNLRGELNEMAQQLVAPLENTIAPTQSPTNTSTEPPAKTAPPGDSDSVDLGAPPQS